MSKASSSLHADGLNFLWHSLRHSVAAERPMQVCMASCIQTVSSSPVSTVAYLMPFTAAAGSVQGALAAGVEVPNLCRTGTCGACASRLLSGDVERTDFLLDDQQKEAGFLLLCTTTVTSDAEIVSHQETEMHTIPYGL